MPIDTGFGGSFDPAAAAAAAAAAEAARVAAEEAARAAAEAAAKAAAEAAAKAAADAAAAAQKAAEEQAQKVNQDRLQAKNFDHMDDKPNFDQMGGNKPADAPASNQPDQSASDQAAQKLANASARADDDPRAAQRLDRLAQDVKPIDNTEAKQQLDQIQEGVKSAKTPEDLQGLQTQSNVLNGRLAASPAADPALVQQAGDLHGQIQQAHEAVETLQAAHTDVTAGDGHDRANAAVKLIVGQTDVAGAVSSLKALPGFGDSPLANQVHTDLQATMAAADPKQLASQIQSDPNVGNYPKDFAANLAKLQGSGDPELQGAIDGVAKNYLASKPSAADVAGDPGRAALVSSLAQSSDPAVHQQLQDTVHDWVQSSLGDHVGNANHESVQKGLDGFKDQLKDLAKATGLGDLIGQQVNQVMGDAGNKAMLEHARHKDEGIWDKAKDALGDLGHLAGDIAGAIGHVVGDALNVVGDAAGNVMHVAGEASAGLAKLESHLVGGALDALGAHDAANAVDHAGDLVADNIQAFGDGMGDGFKGMASGIGFMVEHPGETGKAMLAMVRNPELALKAGEALVNEAMKGGPAHAAGYIAANLLPVLLTGGAEAGVGAAAAAGKVAQVAGKVAELAGSAAEAGNAVELAGKVAQGAGKVAEVADKLATAGGKSAELAGKAGEEAGAAEAVAGKLGEQAGEAASTASKLGQRLKTELNETFNSVHKVAKDVSSLKTTLLGDGEKVSLASEIRALPQGVIENFRSLGDALKGGDFRAAFATAKDNAVVDLGARTFKAGKGVYSIGKDTLKVGTDATKLVLDPLGFVAGKVEGRVVSKVKEAVTGIQSTRHGVRQFVVAAGSQPGA